MPPRFATVPVGSPIPVRFLLARSERSRSAGGPRGPGVDPPAGWPAHLRQVDPAGHVPAGPALPLRELTRSRVQLAQQGQGGAGRRLGQPRCGSAGRPRQPTRPSSTARSTAPTASRKGNGQSALDEVGRGARSGRGRWGSLATSFFGQGLGARADWRCRRRSPGAADSRTRRDSTSPCRWPTASPAWSLGAAARQGARRAPYDRHASETLPRQPDGR